MMTQEEKRLFSQRLATLSRRQRQVFDRIIKGKTTPEIAKNMNLAAKTVETHRMMINRKLGSDSPVDLVRMALLSGAIGIDALE